MIPWKLTEMEESWEMWQVSWLCYKFPQIPRTQRYCWILEKWWFCEHEPFYYQQHDLIIFLHLRGCPPNGALATWENTCWAVTSSPVSFAQIRCQSGVNFRSCQFFRNTQCPLPLDYGYFVIFMKYLPYDVHSLNMGSLIHLHNCY